MNSGSYCASELRTQHVSIRSYSQSEGHNFCRIAISDTFQRLKKYLGVARVLEGCDAAIRRCRQEWVDSDKFQRHDGSDRPRATTDREDRLIVSSAATAPDSSLSTIRHTTHTRVSSMTIHRRLIDCAWLNQVGNMLTGDAEYLATNAASTCVLMIIEDVSGERQGRVRILLSLLHDIQALNQELWSGAPFLLTSGLLQDNSRVHTTRVAMNCLEAFQRLSWPVRSPGVSLTEHVWDMMGRRLHVSRNVDNLPRLLEQIWQEILQETIRVLYYSLSRRGAACIQARGGSTPF
ncbi:transposable element Tcb1 transposase [Trichonephila clavipes]|nr:transposable element Tcb1 transposase [Trichonephila clavipes]